MPLPRPLPCPQCQLARHWCQSQWRQLARHRRCWRWVQVKRQVQGRRAVHSAAATMTTTTPRRRRQQRHQPRPCCRRRYSHPPSGWGGVRWRQPPEPPWVPPPRLHLCLPYCPCGSVLSTLRGAARGGRAVYSPGPRSTHEPPNHTSKRHRCEWGGGVTRSAAPADGVQECNLVRTGDDGRCHQFVENLKLGQTTFPLVDKLYPLVYTEI